MSALGDPFPLVIAAPSGTGKTSLAHGLVASERQAVFSVSATTRLARPEERDGIDYHFVSDEDFDRMIEQDALVEWATVHGRRYGTPWSSVREALEAGSVVVLDIDIQGAKQVREVFDGAVLVFILPPTGGELNRRLSERGSEGDAERFRRLRNALDELDAVEDFDYVVVNDDFDSALDRLRSIVAGERARVARVSDLRQRVRVIKEEIGQLVNEEQTT